MTRIDTDAASFKVACAGYTIECTPWGLPLSYESIREHAVIAEEIELDKPGQCCFAIKKCGELWPFLVVAQSFSPSSSGFEPGCLLEPDKKILFIGAGERILAYRLDHPKRLWEDRAETGFLRWEQYGDTVLLAAELEFAAWNTAGKKLWTMFVEPPWEYKVHGETIDLDVMGTKQTFGLHEGPP